MGSQGRGRCRPVVGYCPPGVAISFNRLRDLPVALFSVLEWKQLLSVDCSRELWHNSAVLIRRCIFAQLCDGICGGRRCVRGYAERRYHNPGKALHRGRSVVSGRGSGVADLVRQCACRDPGRSVEQRLCEMSCWTSCRSGSCRRSTSGCHLPGVPCGSPPCRGEAYPAVRSVPFEVGGRSFRPGHERLPYLSYEPP
jgi:hypothetical protein